MAIRHLNEDTQQRAGGYLSLELRGLFCTKDINLEVINMQIIFKTRTLDDVTKKTNVDRKEIKRQVMKSSRKWAGTSRGDQKGAASTGEKPEEWAAPESM